MRPSGRAPDEMRVITMETGVSAHAEGSCLVSFGQTRVLATATVEEKVPGWMKGKGRGWVTAEYGMLPRSTHERSQREAVRGKQGGRTLEISRLIGRSLRAGVDLELLGERQIILDCDVLQADGGTRTAAISGAWVALKQAVVRLGLAADPMPARVAAISCGVTENGPVLDLDYAEDSAADADANFVLLEGGRLIEVQASAERAAFDEETLLRLLRLARIGGVAIMDAQARALAR
ncbi:MAG: ribonuclease PH [Sphingomonadaceae bacterium]|nr:ribonuclease PH [Sphingomonadaceae bacterium]